MGHNLPPLAEIEPIAKIIHKCQKCAGMGLNGFIVKRWIKVKILQRKKNIGAVKDLPAR